MMYYVEGDTTVNDLGCASSGFPSFKFKDIDGIYPENIPHTASLIPEADRILKQAEHHLHDVNEMLKQKSAKLKLDMLKLDHEIENQQKALRLNIEKIRIPKWGRPSSQDRFGDVGMSDLDMNMEGEDPFMEEPDIMDQIDTEDDLRVPEWDQYGGGSQADSMDGMRNQYDENLDSAEPQSSETYNTFQGEDGGKGYERNRNEVKSENIPGGKSVSRTSHHEYSYHSPPRGSGSEYSSKTVSTSNRRKRRNI